MNKVVKNLVALPLAITLSASTLLADQLKVEVKATDLITGQTVTNFGSSPMPGEGGAGAFALSVPGPSGQIFITVNGNSSQQYGQLASDQYNLVVTSASSNPVAIELDVKRELTTPLEYPIVGGTLELNGYGIDAPAGQAIANIIADGAAVAGSEIATSELTSCGRGCAAGLFGNGETSLPTEDIADSLGFELNLKVSSFGTIQSIVTVDVSNLKVCPDFDGNDHVDAADLGVLLGAYGPSSTHDITGDDLVDGADLGKILGAFGACPL